MEYCEAPLLGHVGTCTTPTQLAAQLTLVEVDVGVPSSYLGCSVRSIAIGVEISGHLGKLNGVELSSRAFSNSLANGELTKSELLMVFVSY